ARMTAFSIVLLYLLSVAAGTYLLARWARWLGGRYGAPRFVGMLRWCFFAVPPLMLAMFVAAFLALRSALEPPAGASAADRQRVLARSIAEALWDAALTPLLL